MLARKDLARKALAAALEIRKTKENFLNPICIYDLAEDLNIGVWFADSMAEENHQIRRVLDEALTSHRTSCNTVANTIFPESLWNPARERALLYQRYMVHTWPRVKKCAANYRGTYFQRLIAFENGDDPINQLEHVITTWHKQNHRHSALQLSVFDPRHDHTDGRRLGFPCLHQVCFTPLGANGAEGLAVTGFYATQHIFEKAYGNYMGLCRLGKFMAHEMKLRFTRMEPAKPTVVYDTYWRLAAERQAILFRRLRGDLPPWTNDSILREYKFTNAYRASDRTSQYLIRNVIYDGDQSPDEVIFRTLLFKFFNRIETWELLSRIFGRVSYKEYSYMHFDAALTKAIDGGTTIYSAAYIMPSGGASSFGRKHRMHLKLLEQMLKDDLPSRLAQAPSMSKAFDLLRAYPTIGDFLAYQYVTDLNYSTLLNFSEMDFVVPGPGARDGLRKCFSDLGGLNEAEMIKFVAERQQSEFSRLGIEFFSLWGRPLQLVDCQSLFCEVDKYSRVKHPEFAGHTGRVRIKQKYRATTMPISHWYPPKWGINEQIKKGGLNVPSI
jgi:hypothetical protein